MSGHLKTIFGEQQTHSVAYRYTFDDKGMEASRTPISGIGGNSLSISDPAQQADPGLAQKLIV
jgi:hypothetical protein